MSEAKNCPTCKRTYPAWEPRCYVCAMTGRKVVAIAALAITLLVSAPVAARPRCVLNYTPSGPIYSQIYRAPPSCDSVCDMGYVDAENNPFTEFHFLLGVPQERRDYYSLHLRLNRPWRIANPKVTDDK